MPNDPNEQPTPGRPQDDTAPRLSDGREHLGEEFGRPVPRDDRELGENFTRSNEYDGKRLGEEFADPTFADRQALAQSFADPNSIDDTKIGKSFEETNSSAKKHHRPVGEVVSAPFHKPGSKKVLYWFIAAVVVLFALILLIGFIPRHNRHKETEAEAKKQTEAPEIEVTRVTRAKDSGGLTVPGTTIPIAESSVYARANGYLKKRFVDIGDHVHKGQLLALIDAPDLDQQVDQAREQLRQAQAQLAQQETQLALTKVTNDRYQALVARGVFSRQEGDQREADYQAQRANVASAERNVEAFQANLGRVIALQSYERVTAPFDGVVTQRNVDAGDLISTQGSAGGSAPAPVPTGSVSSGSTQNAATNTSGASGTASNLATPSTGGGGQGGSLFTIAQSDRLRILVSVPEGYASEITPGAQTQLTFQEYPNRVFYGGVTRNSGSIDQNTRTLLTEILIDNHSGLLIPGMYAVVTFAAPRGAGPLVVTGDAIAIRKDQPMVAVINNDKVKLTPVVIGRDYGPEVEIVSGLKEGELIATSFTDEVRDGVNVRTRIDKDAEDQANPHLPDSKATPPGGSTQYSDPGITDQDMQGQNAKPQQKQGKGGAQKKATPKNGSTQ